MIKTLTAIAAFSFIVINSAQASNCYEAGCFYEVKSYGSLPKVRAHKQAHRKKIYLSPLRKATHKPKIQKPIEVASKPETLISGLVKEARRYLGMSAAQVGVRRDLWCSAFLRKLTKASGVDDRAISWLRKQRTKPTINSIAVMAHHVGIVVGFKGDSVILISGNHGNRVGIGPYAKHRIIAYVKV